MKKNVSMRLTESAIMLAFAVVLSLVKIVDMPYGGTVTAASTLPLILIAYRYGTGWGLFTGFTGSILMLILGMNNLSYATSGGAVAAIIFLDYVGAFTLMGLGGIFRGRIQKQSTALAAGTLIACTLRFVCHVISGATVWAGVSIPDTDGLIFSLGYNAVYMVPETIITIAAAVALGSLFDFSKESIAPVAGSGKKESKNPLRVLILLIAAGVDALFLFSATQVDAAGEVVFSVKGLGSANWLLIGVITAGALAAYLVSKKLLPLVILATGGVYGAAALIQSGVSDTDPQWTLIFGVVSFCVVLALVGYKLYRTAAAAAGILAGAGYFLSLLLAGDGMQSYDFIMIAFAVLGGLAASAAIGRYMTADEKSSGKNLG